MSEDFKYVLLLKKEIEKELISEFVEDLKTFTIPKEGYPNAKDKIRIIIKKWEERAKWQK